MEELKSFKVVLDYYDEDGKNDPKPMTIKVNNPKYIGEKGIHFEKRLWAMTFSLVIPDHVHKYLIGKTVHVNRGIGSGNRDETKLYDVKFSKTITADSVQRVCELYWNVCVDYLWLKKIEKAELEKVIFYDFDSSNNDDFKSTWNGIYFGVENEILYKYSIGYISNDGNRYNSTKNLINKHYDSEFYRFNHVKWTSERESFFIHIGQSFDTIIQRLKFFQERISEDSLDNLIINRSQKLLE